MAAKIASLQAKNNAIFARINNLYDTAQKIPLANVDLRSTELFMSQTETLQVIRTEFIDNLDSINELSFKEDPDFKFNYQSLSSFEDLYASIQRVRSRILANVTRSDDDKGARPHVKLPPINIPSFDGKMENWPIFYESFKTNIHLNQSLTDAQRVQYLIGKLTGSALKIIAGIIPSGENYSSIWESLVKKYQDKRALGCHYLSILFNIKSSTNNSSSLNNFVESFDAAVSALENLKIEDLKDFILLNLAMRKLDPSTAQAFESLVRDKDIPSYAELIDFIKSQVKILDRTASSSNRVSTSVEPQHNNNTKRAPRHTYQTQTFLTSEDKVEPCLMCNKSEHQQLYKCPAFKSLTAKGRFDFIKSKRACINCLSMSHTASFCNSNHSCKNCRQFHHSLLHMDINKNRPSSAPRSQPANAASGNEATVASPQPADLHTKSSENSSSNVRLCAHACTPTDLTTNNDTILLSTAQVNIQNTYKQNVSIRCLIDNASQDNLITYACCERLKLKIIPLQNSCIKGIGSSSQPVRGYVQLCVSSKDKKYSYNILALVIDKLTDRMPSEYIDSSVVQHLVDLPLADPLWHIPGEVELILGARLFPHLLLGRKIMNPSAPAAIETVFGFILTGDAPTANKNNTACSKLNTSTFFTCSSDGRLGDRYDELRIDKTLTKFWEMEEMPSIKFLSPEETQCEEIYTSTVSRDSDGRYCTALPFCRDPSELGDSRSVAVRRLYSLERKLQDPELRASFNEVIQDYLDNDYLSEVPPDNIDYSTGYFIPMHVVVRSDKETTKVRPVLDASTKCHNDISLNDILHTGPNLQADIFVLLLNFRLFEIALAADIKQMYLRILIKPEHRKYQKILYRFDPSQPIREFQFNRVTFGLKCSPFLAMRTVRQLAADERYRFPRAADVASHELYMDDLTTSVPTIQEGKAMAKELIDLFQAGGFHLTKWASNSPEILQSVPQSNRAAIEFSDNANMKVLGLKWLPAQDIFTFSTSPTEETFTKRTILSTIARLWDVLGFAAPVILFAKLLIKELWLLKVGWDDPLPENILSSFRTFNEQLPLLSSCKIPRHLGVRQGCSTNIVAFADASLKAYGSVVYLHATDSEGNVQVNLICAKSKVAPVKVVSLARLELCAAVLMSKLVRLINETYSARIKIDNIFAFSDSKIALSWINSLPHRWDIYVSNRVAQCQENLDPRHFYHVSGSTTDLTPTLIGIYDSLLAQEKSLRPESEPLETAKDARNDPPVPDGKQTMIEETKDSVDKSIETTKIDDYKIEKEVTEQMKSKDPTKIAGGVKLPIASMNKSTLYTMRTKSDENGASEKSDVPSDSVFKSPFHRTFCNTKETSAFGYLSPNVKRMISGAAETTTLKFQKKTVTAGRSSTRHKSNIPLVGATSKISQSGVELLPSVEIYDQPCSMKSFGKSKSEDNESASKTVPTKPEFELDEPLTYDVPTNNRPAIYDVPTNKTAFESLSLPYIDQSVELSITSNDREFDIKLSSKDNSPVKAETKISPKGTPAKIPKMINGGTNSLNRKDFKESPSKLVKVGPYPEVVGSTGNLKSSIPEKEVIRLNPAVEVTRPLSMSSIASSSSTSSSGVQNKGGVNSAYLASIESLDDHSDADMTSANGSNHFVNNAGVKTSLSEERRSESPRQAEDLSGLSQLERVCAEIVQTEHVYVEDLRQVVEGYLHEWRREATFSDEELIDLFNNIENIYAFNRSLCEELNSCHLDATCIARCFVNNTSGFAVYTSYCTGYPRTMERLAALASDKNSAREFRERQIALGHPLPLASYLLKPVQRILKYHLLLQNVVKQCQSRETEYALLKMTGIAQHIDDMKRRHEHAVRVQEIQSLLYGWNGPDLTTYGELCAEGTFRVFGAKAMRHAFLFDKMLLVTKNREDGILAYKSHIMCNNMMLVESIAGAPLSFHVIPWDAPRAQLTLQARSPRHKREWTLLLKRVILENYNAVIPSHARQLVMELGQNKTDDDMLAEKSHNLITQASMRKQLSAPEYLEKRKLERERRKSFENGIRGRLKKVNRKYTVPSSTTETSQECDCAQVSVEKGTDYTCDTCYVDLCSDCEVDLNKDKVKDDKCNCSNEAGEKCPECDRSLHYINAGSAEHLERTPTGCKCSDFQSSQESFNKEFPSPTSLTKTRGYHSSDNIVGYTDSSKSKDDLTETNNSLLSVRNIPKTCLKCAKIKENIPVTDLATMHTRKSRCNDVEKKQDSLRSKSKDDPQRSKLSKIGTWRRKSEPGLQQNPGIVIKKSQDSDSDKNDVKGNEKIEFECKNCGSNKITKKVKINEAAVLSDPELEGKKKSNLLKPNIEIKMYNSKNIPKKISKLKKNRTKGLRLGSDTTAKFYADLSSDVSTENILHISESNDSLNVEKKDTSRSFPDSISKDADIDEETYKKLIEKTDSFKKNELEKVKYLNKQKVINEGSEAEESNYNPETGTEGIVPESFEASEQPLEQIISQLLMQNREFQKILKKQQLRNSAQRRHQRLLKSHSNPEQVILNRNTDSLKLKPKYSRQTSENLDTNKDEEIEHFGSTHEMDDVSEEDHIYETLRVENRVNDNIDLNTKTSHNTGILRRLPSPPTLTKHLPDGNRTSVFESDYVYLSFDKLNVQNSDGVYDVPVKSPAEVDQQQSNDYYVTMETQGPPSTAEDTLYDNLVKVRRKKEVPNSLPNEYLPMSPDQQSPNTPEIWLSRQKEHFNVSRDRKSGSLPRSFQVVTPNQEENNLSTFKCKPNSNSKTYLNREGKVLSIDRPFTIASDQSEISYDDVENYMPDGDILKFNKNSKSNEADYVPNISQSTLELEEEIDRCYKTNFENVTLDKNKNESLVTTSQPNLNTSITSSCEIISQEQNDVKPKDIEIIHPEHKIYKPTSNMLSLKNVLSRFRNRTPNKNNEDTEINANEENSSPDSLKSDPKSPTTEKRSALNPRSYSKNLLQRFRSIIGDEHPDDNQNRTELKSSKSVDDSQNNLVKGEIKVIITSTDTSPTISTTVYAINSDALSKSVYETTTLSESQNEKNNLDLLSHSCDNITQKSEISRPGYEKSVSMVTSVSSISSITSQTKSNNSSYQTLNKLPIYMQGSRMLGARIAQSDYADPTTLASEKSAIKNVNVLINKNAVRPDSLFSNYSFVTSSSEGAYQEQGKANDNQNSETNDTKTKPLESTIQAKSDESYYEKSFEKIEQVFDEDVFRDSAVYSDDNEDGKTDNCNKGTNKTVLRVESIKRNASIKSQKVSVTTTFKEKNSITSHTTITTNKFQQNEPRSQNTLTNKSKIAPPVPVKPKITNIPTASMQNKSFMHRNSKLGKSQEETTSESVRTIKRNPTNKNIRTESTPAKVTEDKANTSEKKEINTIDAKEEVDGLIDKIKIQGSIQMKRLSFERASLDSATRKTKTIEKRSSIEPSKVTTKSVLERRMEIEQLSRTQIAKPTNIKKPAQIAKPKSITTKVATYERSVSDNGRRDSTTPSTTFGNIPQDRNSISEPKLENDELKGSWVKQVVNKFQ